jgi:hypothetical protein
MLKEILIFSFVITAGAEFRFGGVSFIVISNMASCQGDQIFAKSLTQKCATKSNQIFSVQINANLPLEK